MHLAGFCVTLQVRCWDTKREVNDEVQAGLDRLAN